MNLMRVMISVLLIVSGLSAGAVAPKADAPTGGNFTVNLGGEPPTLHPIMSTDVYGSNVQSMVLDQLLWRDPETYDWKPRMAEKWEVSKDGMVFTFHLRKGMKFHDGKEVTAEDVKFSLDAIREPKYEAAHLIPYYEGIAKVEILDPHTVKFTAKDTYYKNFDVVAGLTVIPKHVYGDADKSKKMTRELVGSGPYRLEKFDRGQLITLKRFDDWYGFATKEWKGAYNFASMTLRFYKEETVILEHAKKGSLDYIDLRPEAYMKKTDGDPWGKTILKKKVENNAPKSYGFVGWNFRKDLFQDRDVRVALAHLMNRPEMNKKFRYEMSDPARGPVFNRSEYASPAVKAIDYDPKKARELLAKAGWADADKNGVLEKTIGDKKVEFKFSLIHANKDNEKYWTMYREDLKKAGIDMEIKYLEWNSFLKLLDEGKFEAVALAWGGGDLFWDPKQIWHSSSAVPGGSNFIAYKNAEVDKLIDEARVQLDRAKRKALLQKVYEKIAADAPYAFLFNDKFVLYAVSSKIGQPADTFKFTIGDDYWWMKP